MILSNFFFTTTSSLEVICYMRHQDIGFSDWGDPFWGNLPMSKCTRFIYVQMDKWAEEGVINYLVTFKQRTPHAKIFFAYELHSKHEMIDSTSATDRTMDGMNLIWSEKVSSPDNSLTKEERTKYVTRAKSYVQGKEVSQSINCKPGTSEIMDTEKIVTSVNLTIVFVVVDKEKVTEFLENPEICVTPLVNNGVPRNKIAIGLRELVGYSGRFREVCKKGPMKQMLKDIAKELSCFVKSTGLYGVMVWYLNDDDYRNQECGMGKYPFVDAHTRALQTCHLLQEVKSSAVVIKSMTMTLVVNVVALTLI